MSLSKLSFVNAVRVVVDLTQPPDLRVLTTSVRQVFFGGPNNLYARKSINGSGECTWHIPFERDEDLSKITLTSPKLIKDDRDKTFYYLLYKGDWSAYNTTSCTGTDTVTNYICRVTSDLARNFEPPRGTEFVPGYMKNCDPRQKKEIFAAKSMEDYFRDQFMLFYIPGFLKLLMSPREGFDQDGRVADGSAGEDRRMLAVRQQHNLDPESVEVFVSYPTLKEVKYF